MSNQYLKQPREVSIETMALCNAACTFCPYPTLERKNTKLCDADLLWLITQMKPWKVPFTIAPFKVNEPFLDKRLLTFCAWINHDLPLASLRIFSNGSRFTKENLDSLGELQRVNHLWISLNESDPIKYKDTMGLNFHHVAEKIDLAHERAAFFNFPVIISRVALPATHSVEEVKARYQFDTLIGKRWPRFSPFHIKRSGWLGYTEPYADVVPKTPCGRWEELSIMANGVAALCCMDGTGKHAVGNIHEQDLLAIYNQPKLLALRMGAVTRTEFEPCNRCTY